VPHDLISSFAPPRNKSWRRHCDYRCKNDWYGGDPFYLKFGVKLTAVIPGEKSSINTDMKSTYTRFPMSLRRLPLSLITTYMVPPGRNYYLYGVHRLVGYRPSL